MLKCNIEEDEEEEDMPTPARSKETELQTAEELRSELELQYLELVEQPRAQDGFTLEQPLPSHLRIVETVATHGACEEPVI